MAATNNGTTSLNKCQEPTEIEHAVDYDEESTQNSFNTPTQVNLYCYSVQLGRCLQHCGGEPEQAKGADGMQPFALDCIAHIVDAEMD